MITSSDIAGIKSCARCSHTLFQHSTGECDMAGCECQGWCASFSAQTDGHLDESQVWILVAVCVTLGGIVGIIIGLVL